MNAVGLRVAVTRDEREDGAMTRALRERGFSPVACAAIREEPAADDNALTSAAARLETYDWIVVAGARAVSAIANARGNGAWPARLRGGAAGARTAQALRDCGLRSVVTGREDGAESLLEALREADVWPGRRVLAPRAAEGRRVAELGLRAAGAEVDEIVAYATAAVPAPILRERWLAARPEAAVIASPSAARSLVGALGARALRELKGVVAIGPTTAAALRELDVPSLMAPHATFEAAAEALRDGLARPGGNP